MIFQVHHRPSIATRRPSPSFRLWRDLFKSTSGSPGGHWGSSWRSSRWWSSDSSRGTRWTASWHTSPPRSCTTWPPRPSSRSTSFRALFCRWDMCSLEDFDIEQFKLSSFVKIQSIEWDGLSHFIVSYCRQSRSKWTHTLGLWFARWISFYFSRFLKSQTTLQIFSRVHEKLIFEKFRFSWAAALRLEQCSNCVKERYIFVIFQDFPVSTFICYLLLISVPLNEYVWLDHA